MDESLDWELDELPDEPLDEVEEPSELDELLTLGRLVDLLESLLSEESLDWLLLTLLDEDVELSLESLLLDADELREESLLSDDDEFEDESLLEDDFDEDDELPELLLDDEPLLDEDDGLPEDDDDDPLLEELDRPRCRIHSAGHRHHRKQIARRYELELLTDGKLKRRDGDVDAGNARIADADRSVINRGRDSWGGVDATSL